MVDENWIQNLLDKGKNFASGVVNTAKKRTSSLPNIAKAAATDLGSTAIALTPGNAVKSAAPPQPAAIVRTVAAPVTPNPLQQVAAPFKKVRNIVRQSKRKPGGPLGNVVNTQVVKPNVNTGGFASANPKGSSVSTGSGGGVTATSSSGVTKPTSRTPGGPLAKAGLVIDVKPVRPLGGSTSSTPVGGSPSVARIPAPKPQPLSFSGLLKRLPKPAKVAKPKPSKLVKGGLETVVYAAGSVVADKAAKALTPSFVKGLAAVTGNTEKMKQRAPSLYGASGPDLTRDIAKGIADRDAQRNFYQRVLKPKPAAPVAAKPKPAAKSVDSRLQKYRDLIKQGKHNMARDLGMQIHADKYGTPSPKTKSRNIA